MILPTNQWEFWGFVALMVFQGWQVWNQRSLAAAQTGLHHEMNSMKDALVAKAMQAGRAEGMVQGAAVEQARVASQLATAIAGQPPDPGQRVADATERIADVAESARKISPLEKQIGPEQRLGEIRGGG